MFGRKFTLFRLLGFEVGLDFSWFLIAILITWSLAAGLFPIYYPGLPRSTYWAMGVVGALGLFGSIIFHEFAHSLVGRRYGMPIKGITLFIFGGVAQMEEEPRAPRAEFMMAVVGPIASFVLAGVFYLLHEAGEGLGFPPPVQGVLFYLGWINLLLALFNLIPAFPLDGGRMLRAALWGWKGRLRWATRIAANIGAGFGILLIVLGVWTVLTGNFIGGMWWFLIGLFLRTAAQGSYQQTLMRRALEGEPVRRFTTTEPITVPSTASIADLVEDYLYRHYHKVFPVVENGRLVGLVASQDVKTVPRAEWGQVTVANITHPVSADNSVAPDADAMTAMAIMNRTRNSRLLVVEDGRLVGIVALKDMLRFLSFKLDLDEEEALPLAGAPRGRMEALSGR